MKPAAAKLKILWSVDAFDDLPDVQDKSVRVLQRFAKSFPIEVDPVYVLNPALLGVSTEFAEPWAEVYVPEAKKAILQNIKGVSIPGLREPQVLSHIRPSLRASAGLLANHARNQDYDLIVVGSHGRKGVQRMFLGSFAEQLLLQATTPVMVVGGHSDAWREQLTQSQLHILVASDLSDPHSSFFGEIFQTAAWLGARVTLLHSIRRPHEAVFQSGVYLLSGGWVSVPIFIEKERRRAEEAGSQVIRLAQEYYDVKCELVIDEGSNSVTEAILTNAKSRQASFIAMAAESGQISTALIGSIAREIVRAAPCPVWVVRPKSAG